MIPKIARKRLSQWDYRDIGKRSKGLNKKAIAAAKRIQKQETKSARWIAADALRELTSDAVKQRLSR